MICQGIIKLYLHIHTLHFVIQSLSPPPTRTQILPLLFMRVQTTPTEKEYYGALTVASGAATLLSSAERNPEANEYLCRIENARAQQRYFCIMLYFPGKTKGFLIAHIHTHPIEVAFYGPICADVYPPPPLPPSDVILSKAVVALCRHMHHYND